MGTASSIGGPPMALVYQHGPGDRLRATLGAYFVAGATMSLSALAVVGRFGPTEAWLGAALVPGIVLGFTASNRLKGLVYSQQVLLALAESGTTREDAYEMVQTQAMRVWKEDRDFKTLILSDPDIAEHLSPEKIEEIFDVGYHLKYISAIFERVFGKQ